MRALTKALTDLERESVEARFGKLLSGHANCKTTVTHKYCSYCDQWKLHSEFYKCKHAELAGLACRCKPCKIRDGHKQILRKHGLTVASYNDLLTKQNSGCAICGNIDTGSKRTQRLNVDHDHVTGKVRGLLCHNCNTSLGGFNDSEVTLMKALEYLRASNE